MNALVLHGGGGPATVAMIAEHLTAELPTHPGWNGTPRAGSESLLKDVRQAVWSVDANLPLTDIHTQEFFFQKSISRTSFTLVMLGIDNGIGLLGLSSGTKFVLTGGVLLLAVTVDSISRRGREASGRA